MRTTWIVQTNVEPESTSPSALQHACAVEQRPFYEISVIPGASTLPEMPTIEGPFVFHGRTTLILRTFEHPLWRRGIFFDPLCFQHRAYAAAYGDHLLNADARIQSWEDFLHEAHDPQELIFLKPNNDLKRFTGGVFSFGDCFTLYTRLRNIQAIEPTSEVVISKPREIDAEWRLFIVDGQVVSGSMYRPSGDVYLPQDLLRFAKSVVSQWTPASVFVLDVARVEETWKVVECNCFNGSRFYLADVCRIVRAVSEHQEQYGAYL